jgi:hypothetical protein
LIQYGENLEEPSNLDEDVDEKDFVNSHFWDLDLKEIEIVKAWSLRKNVHFEFWVKNAFDVWRWYKKFHTSKIICELHKFNHEFFVDCLTEFMLQVSMKYGNF